MLSGVGHQLRAVLRVRMEQRRVPFALCALGLSALTERSGFRRFEQASGPRCGPGRGAETSQYSKSVAESGFMPACMATSTTSLPAPAAAVIRLGRMVWC